MLVLTRKSGESLLLGDEIEIRIVRIDGDQVRIGIVAPRSVQIVRGELVEEIERETSAAAAPNREALGHLSRRLKNNAPATAVVAVPAAVQAPLEPAPVLAATSGKTCRNV